MARSVTVTKSILIRRSPEDVWDFTQDYARRRTWDVSVLEVTVLADQPVPRVRVRLAGGVSAVFQYKQFDRPMRTSLAMEDVQSLAIQGGGGSWSYEAKDGGTLWTQTNTLVVKPGWWRTLLTLTLPWQLALFTGLAMKKAKATLERGH